MASNDRFANARRAARLTEAQVAERVADYLESKSGGKKGRTAIDADHVSRIETGRITWPNREYREAFRFVLGATSDAELGLYHRGASKQTLEVSVDVDNNLLALAGAATIGALDNATMDAVSGGMGRPGTPKRIGRIDADDLQYVIDGMERADHAAGGRTVVRSLALQQLTWAQEALKLASFRTADVRGCWMSAVARLGRLAGFMSVDARDHQTARRCFLIGLQIAGDANDWPSRLNVLSGMARQAVHLGDGEAALKICTLARAGESAASATTRAMLSVLEARAYGVLGRADKAVTAVGVAEEHYGRRSPGDDPAWLWFYDDAQLLGDTGHALFPLALAGHNVDAEQRLQQAVDLHHPGDTRGRTFSLTKLATLQIRRDPGELAYQSAQEAISAVGELRSGRALDYLNDMGRVLRRTDTSKAAELAGQVSNTLTAVRRD